MPVKAKFSGLDYSLEGTSTGVWMPVLSAANFTAQATAIAAIQAAIQGVSLIDYEGQEYPAMVEVRETIPPTSPFAQRESKWLVTMTDNVTLEINQFEIGGPDLVLLVAGTQLMDVSGGAGAALVTALEANAQSKLGNSVTFVSAKHVGRNI